MIIWQSQLTMSIKNNFNSKVWRAISRNFENSVEQKSLVFTNKTGKHPVLSTYELRNREMNKKIERLLW